MQRPDYFQQFMFNWDAFDVMVGGMSSLDVNDYLVKVNGPLDVINFLKAYGFDYNDPIQKAELFGNLQEAIQFIKRYFLKEGNPDGLDLKIPNVIYTITDISQLFEIAGADLKEKNSNRENAIWAGILLKVMHTILHADKDLRYRYFTTIQTQVFDRFYKFLDRKEHSLLLINEQGNEKIELIEFETKSKKTRDSIIIKLLHKKENVAEELFDRIGIRFITKNKLDALRVLRFMHNNYVVVPQNVKPSRSLNTLVDLSEFKKKHYQILKEAIRKDLTESEMYEKLLDAANNSRPSSNQSINQHSFDEYAAIHLTCRQLIKYRNPFMDHFSEIKKMAKENNDNDLAKKILSIDTSSVTRDVNFFYPFEVQITDMESHKKNTEGEASHTDYKRSQVKSAMVRIFKPLIEYKNIKV